MTYLLLNLADLSQINPWGDGIPNPLRFMLDDEARLLGHGDDASGAVDSTFVIIECDKRERAKAIQFTINEIAKRRIKRKVRGRIVNRI